MSSKVWSIGFSKHEKMIKYHVHIRSKDQFNNLAQLWAQDQMLRRYHIQPR